MANPLFESVSKLPRVTLEAAREYSSSRKAIAARVDSIMESLGDLSYLIGGNPASIMRTNHANHAGTMANTFLFGRYELLALNVPWVYRAYIAHGFSPDYFPLVFEAFKRSIRETLSPESAEAVIPVYDWLLDNHVQVLAKRFEADEAMPAPSREKEAERVRFRNALLSGDHGFCLKEARRILTEGGGVSELYLHIIQPSLYEIGRLWEMGEISVAEEHLASAVAGRVMAAFYAEIASSEKSRKSCVVTAVTNEHHEIGARMVADLLEGDGWEVHYLGSNIEIEGALLFINKMKPFFVALSSALPFTLEGVAEMITALRGDPETSGVKIMVGGLAFSGTGDFWKELGADGFAGDAAEAVKLAGEWFSSEDRRRSG